LLFELFFNGRPSVLFPFADSCLVPLQRPTDGPLRAPVQPAKNLPHMTRVIADAKLLLDQIRDTLAGPQRRLITEFLGTSQQTLHKLPVLIRIELRHPTGAPRLAESLLSTFLIFLTPAADGLVGHLKLLADLAVIQSLSEKSHRFHSPRFQSFEIAAYSARIPHAYPDARTCFIVPLYYADVNNKSGFQVVRLAEKSTLGLPGPRTAEKWKPVSAG